MLRLMLPQWEPPDKPNQDLYIVSATVPAVFAEGDAPSYFQYLLKHPTRSKEMLFKLDYLAATARASQPGFYMIQIKEMPDTT
jgi:hypothetical protein